jgi:hypothetical protein
VIHKQLTAARLEAREIRVHGVVDRAHEGEPRRILVEIEIDGAVAFAGIILERHVAQEVLGKGVDQPAAGRLKTGEPEGPIGF